MFRDSALQGQTFPLGAQLDRGCQLQSPNFRWSEPLPPPHHRGFLKTASGLSGAKDLAGIKDLNVRGLHRPEIRKSLLWPALACSGHIHEQSCPWLSGCMVTSIHLQDRPFSIVDGEDADAGSGPWQVSLNMRGEFLADMYDYSGANSAVQLGLVISPAFLQGESPFRWGTRAIKD